MTVIHTELLQVPGRRRTSDPPNAPSPKIRQILGVFAPSNMFAGIAAGAAGPASAAAPAACINRRLDTFTPRSPSH